MLKLLIADSSEPYTDALNQIFQAEFELEICSDGETALEKLVSFSPDLLIINLALPYKDGLTVLQESSHKPRVILAISPYINTYIEQAAANLGVQYLMILPTVQTIRVRLMDMITSCCLPAGDLTSQTLVHLHSLGFQTHLDGYRQLSTGIPLFAEHPDFLLCKELYPAIAKALNYPDFRAVERSIRKSIHNAWLRKDPVIWAKYFSPNADNVIPCPTNKAFISRIAEMLDK